MASAFIRAYKRSLAYVIETPAVDVARQEMEAGFFPEINFEVLTDTVSAYQSLDCWESETAISETSFQNLQNVFLYNKDISRCYRYDEVVVKVE